jgi:hypothetical protein
MRTISQSESTRVPPVTDEKSPPASRMTGADSPVMALSSTEAAPSITSPSSGITSLGSTRTTLPLCSSLPLTSTMGALRRGSDSSFAVTSWRALRNAAAWARPRPSATASAKLAKSTVNQSHSDTAKI